MAEVTTSTGANFIPELWKDAIMDFAERKFQLRNQCMDFSSLMSEGGDILHIPKVTEETAANLSSGSAVTYGANTDGKVDLTVDQQAAELQRRTLEQMGKAQQAGFTTALGAAQRQQQVGLQAGQQLGQLGLTAAGIGQQQQQMAQGDINQLMAAGGVQRQLAQAALDAQRQTTLQQQYEPYQRAEFLANLYAAGPKTQSGVTMGTTPSTSPLAQSIGTGIGAFAAYQGAQQT